MARRHVGLVVLSLHLRLVYVFLYAPILVLMVLSLNRGGMPTAWTGVSFKWYARLAESPEIISAAVNTLIVASVSTVIATILGTLKFRPDAVPYAVGLFITAGWLGGYKAIPAGGLTLAHLVATGRPHELMSDFTLSRFRHLDYVMESGTTTAR